MVLFRVFYKIKTNKTIIQKLINTLNIRKQIFDRYKTFVPLRNLSQAATLFIFS